MFLPFRNIQLTSPRQVFHVTALQFRQKTYTVPSQRLDDEILTRDEKMQNLA
jgi:hypothetical protein